MGEEGEKGKKREIMGRGRAGGGDGEEEKEIEKEIKRRKEEQRKSHLLLQAQTAFEELMNEDRVYYSKDESLHVSSRQPSEIHTIMNRGGIDKEEEEEERKKQNRDRI